MNIKFGEFMQMIYVMLLMQQLRPAYWVSMVMCRHRCYGIYGEYTGDVRLKIARYANKHGNTAAARPFSKKRHKLE